MWNASPPRMVEPSPRIAPPEYREESKKKIRKGYTINQINHIRKILDKAPNPISPPPIIGILNLKGGSQKTTTCHLFSQHLAIQGYKVLVVDTDPQGSLSALFGKMPGTDIYFENTIGPFILEQDELLTELGYPEGTSSTLHYAIQKTYWDNIDIIPCCLENLGIDLELPLIMNADDGDKTRYITKLSKGLTELKTNYDYIIIDGTPSLNLSTINVVCACDVIFVPTPAEMMDFMSTLQFCTVLSETLEKLIESKIDISMPEIKFFINSHRDQTGMNLMRKIIKATNPSRY